MSYLRQLRGDTSSNLASVVPAAKEIAVNTTDKRIHLGDGSTTGGIPHPNYIDQRNNVYTAFTASGTNTLTATLSPAPSSYVANMGFLMKAAATNTGAVTLNLNGLGAKNVYKITAGTLGALIAGDIVNGALYEIFYDGTQFQIQLGVGGLTDVSQGDLNTSTGTISSSTWTTGLVTNVLHIGTTPITKPGGQYGFTLETDDDTSSSNLAGWWEANTSGSYAAQVINYANFAGTPGGTVSGRQRYITSSPPFNLGDGEVGGFIFAIVNPAGDIVSHYAADVPPWGYNGPTSIRAAKKCPITGKKFRKVIKQRTLEEFMDGAAIEYQFEEITDEIKNADMDLIPHPFSNVLPDHSVVMIDPMDDRVKKLIELQNSGSDEVMEAIVKGFITIDNDKEQKRKCPKGVSVHRMKFKYTKRK